LGRVGPREGEKSRTAAARANWATCSKKAAEILYVGANLQSEAERSGKRPTDTTGKGRAGGDWPTKGDRVSEFMNGPGPGGQARGGHLGVFLGRDWGRVRGGGFRAPVADAPEDWIFRPGQAFGTRRRFAGPSGRGPRGREFGPGPHKNLRDRVLRRLMG